MAAQLRQAMIADLEALRQIWEPGPDLLSSVAGDCHFVVEMDDNRFGHLRLGNGESGRAPDAGTTFQAIYRVGNGPAGNVGAGAISHIVFRRTALSGVEIRPCNPLPAVGGSLPESLAEVKLIAPGAFRKTLQRAITADDHTQIVIRDFKHKVQRAAAVLRWTGSWYEAQVAVDAVSNIKSNDELMSEIARHLHRYRRIGHDLRVVTAHYVPLEIELTVCVLPHYLRGHVEAALLDFFSNRVLSDGRIGFFHPDNLTFGEGIYLSKLVAVAQAVTGVESVHVTKLERFAEGPNGEIENGILPLGPLEIAQLDNDPSFLERGALKLTMGGGR
jgi:predicted phage baseplate assembly protein